MKKINIIFSVFIALTPKLFAEETDAAYIFPRDPREADKVAVTYANYISRTIERAHIAGVGHFMNQPSETNRFAEVFVDECWTGNVTNDIVQIKFGIYDSSETPSNTDWVIPLDDPIVFFAVTHSNYMVNGSYMPVDYMFNIGMMSLTNEPGIKVVSPPRFTPEDLVSYSTNTTLYFPGGDSAWFRTTRDDGLLYTFTTNLWENMIVNPNTNNLYCILSEAVKVEMDVSKRIYFDSFKGFRTLLMKFTPEFLVDEYYKSDHKRVKHYLEIEIRARKWNLVNGVWEPPPSQ